MKLPRVRQIAFLFSATVLLCADARTQEKSGLEAVEAVATEWARIRAETVREESDWRWQKSFLEATLGALVDRARILEEKRDFLEASSARLRRSFSDQGLKNEEAEALFERALERSGAVARELVRLRPLLPPRLSAALEYSFLSLEDPALGLSERIQTAATIFNRCTQFNSAITYSEEMATMVPGESARFVSVLYWGLSHGYALDSATGESYLGRPGEEGWAWEARPEIAPAVARLMSMHHDEMVPGFVEVPAQLVDLETETAAP